MNRWMVRTAEGLVQRNMPIVTGAATALGMLGATFGARVPPSNSWRHHVLKHLANYKHRSGRISSTEWKQYGVKTARGSARCDTNCAEEMDRARLATMRRGQDKNAEQSIRLESRTGLG